MKLPAASFVIIMPVHMTAPEKKDKRKTLFIVGIILVAANYVLMVPVLLLTSFSIGGKSWIWLKVAAVLYALSWALFGAGFLAAGPHAVRTVRQWLLQWLTRKP